MKTLFLNPPSFEGFDGGAGSRYQAKREIRSFWYPTWLAQPAALVPNSKLVDAPAAGLSLADVLRLANRYELLVMHTSTPSFGSDVHVAEACSCQELCELVGFFDPPRKPWRHQAGCGHGKVKLLDMMCVPRRHGQPPARM